MAGVIKTLQAQWRQLGRIRIGEQVAYQKGGQTKYRASALSTFRLTSPSKELLDRAADIYHGEVRPWNEGDRHEFELITTVDRLDIIVPPGATLSQNFELWAAGGAVRRCDGETELLSTEPCKCDPDPAKRQCKPVTRLSVILPKLPDVGIWRADTSSYYAAVELLGTVNLLRSASERGELIPAQLWIDQRSVKRPNEPRKDFPVLAIAIPQTMAELVAVAAGDTVPQLGAGNGNGEAFVPAVPPTTPQAPGWGTEAELPTQAEPLVQVDDRPPTPPADPVTGEVLDDFDLSAAAPVTFEAFHAALAEHSIPPEYVKKVAAELFKGRTDAPRTIREATSEQRGELLAAMVAGLEPVATS